MLRVDHLQAHCPVSCQLSPGSVSELHETAWRANLLPWREMCLNMISLHGSHSLSVVQGPGVHPQVVGVLLPCRCRGVNAVELSTFLLSERHEDDGAFRDDCVDN